MKVLLLILIATGPIFTACQYGGGEQPHSQHPPNAGGGEQPHSQHSPNAGGGEQPHSQHSPNAGGGEQPYSQHSPNAGGGEQPHSQHQPNAGGGEQPYSQHSQNAGGGEQTHSQHSKNPDGWKQPGGENILDQKDSSVQSLFKFLERLINDKSEQPQYLKPTSAIKVTEQDISGIINYRVYDLGFSESSCTKSAVRENPNTMCTVEESDIIDTCSFQVSWNPRETPEYKMINEECE